MNCLRYPLPPATPIAQCYLVVDHFLLFIVLVGLLSPWALALVAISLEDEMLLVLLMLLSCQYQRASPIGCYFEPGFMILVALIS